MSHSYSPFEADFPRSPLPHQQGERALTIKVPSLNGMNTNLRRSSRHRNSVGTSGSEYHASEKSPEAHDIVELPPPPETALTRSGRRVTKTSYVESSDGEGDAAPEDLFANDRNVKQAKRRNHASPNGADDEDEDDAPPYPTRRTRSTRNLQGFIETDEEDTKPATRYSTRSRDKAPKKSNGNGSYPNGSQRNPRATRIQPRRRLQSRRGEDDAEDDFVPERHSSPGSADMDAEGSDDIVQSSDLEIAEPEPEPEPEIEEEGQDGRPYALRQRQRINYAIPPPLEEMSRPPKPARPAGRAGGYGGGGHHNAARKARAPGWSASGKELGKWMGMNGDDSVCLPFFFVVSVLCSEHFLFDPGLGPRNENASEAFRRYCALCRRQCGCWWCWDVGRFGCWRNTLEFGKGWRCRWVLFSFWIVG